VRGDIPPRLPTGDDVRPRSFAHGRHRREPFAAGVADAHPVLPAEPVLTDIAPPPPTLTAGPDAAASALSAKSVAKPGTAKRLPFIDALRGIAAMWVVIFHIGEGGQIAALQAVIPAWFNQAVFKSGHFGVPIFFVLSGFVIALSIGSDRVTAGYTGRFALRRAIRLDLPYWAAIAITLTFTAIKARMLPNTGVPIATVPQVLAHMFYLQDFIGFHPINTVFWTLCFEIQFYLMFCALLGVSYSLVRDPADLRPRAIIFTLAAITSIIWPLVPALYVRGLAMPNWHGFLLGAFVFWSLKGVMRARWFVLYALALTGVFAITHDSFTMVCITTATIILLVGRADKLSQWFTARWLQFLGKVSYSVYLLHLPISGAAFFALNNVLPHTPALDVVAALIVIALNCVVSQLFWWGVERPSTSLAKRLRKA
jgi:peptidoglycan/LPS O-acetylase OafA/YrhL